MEKWKCRGKNTNKVEINHGNCTQNSSSSSFLLSSEKKGKKWSFSNFLKRKSKNSISTTSNANDISSTSNYSKNLDSKSAQSHNHSNELSSHSSIIAPNQRIKTTNEHHEKAINNFHHSEHESQESSINLYNPSMHSRNSGSSSETFKGSNGNNIRRDLIKARIKAKRERYCENRSSSDDEHYSNCSLAIIQSEDNLQNMYKSDNNRRTRGARTERYMKRLYRDDTNGGNDYHKVIKNNVYAVEHLPSIKSKKKLPSDILSPYLWTINNKSQLQPIGKMPQFNHQLFKHEHSNIENYTSNKKLSKCSNDLYDNENISSIKCTRSLNREFKTTPIANNTNASSNTHIHTQRVQPPLPPPRSSKSRLYTSPLRHKKKNSNVDSEYLDINTKKCKKFPHYNNINCNSLDRTYTTRKNPNYQSHCSNDILSRHSFNGELKYLSYDDTNDYAQIQKKQLCDIEQIEKPIVPNLQKIQRISPLAATISPVNNLSELIIQQNQTETERKRHSKNLEEALEELEIIYNSLHLNNDEDLLDRAEQRSMDEYREKIATAAVEGSIKSSSDTSSSYEMSNELTWRHTTTFDQCPANDTRLKDDMAYRRTQQHERSSSVDPNQMSLSQYSYLTNSPILSRTNDTHYNNIFNNDKPKSRRGTPDLMRDDVVFRTINHANNTLKIIEPQPPFGIPIGPVTTAVESDYLHIEPTNYSSRSSYIPQSEPDIITDDLAFRNLRKDTTKCRTNHLSNMNFIPKIEQFSEMKKKRAVRSLSADLYGIINESNGNQHAWYKEYVKLNRPRRLSDCNGDLSGDELNTNSWISNREYFDLDINGNRPKSTYQGRVQVCIPQEDDKLIELNKTIIDENIDKHIIPLSSPNIDIKIPNVVNTIESSTDNNELTEYKELCHNLECLINKISEKAKCVDIKSSDDIIETRKSSLNNFVEWDEFFSKDDARSMENKLDELLKSSIENEMDIKQRVAEEKVEKMKDHDKVPYKLSDIHKELYDSPKNTLSLIIDESEKDLENNENNIVIDKNTCTKFNLSNNVPYESSDITELTNNPTEIIQKNFSPKNNKASDNSSVPINFNENKITIESDETKDLTILKPFSITSLTNITNNNHDNNSDDKKNDDCIHESSINEGEEFGNECITSSSLCQTSHNQINVCLFNTNCLSIYYVALCSVCLTLLIAIIVAR